MDSQTIRVGIILEGHWGLYTRWQHLACTVFNKVPDGQDLEISLMAIEGFLEMDPEPKEMIRTRFKESQNEIDPELVPIDPDEMTRKNWSTPMDPPLDLLMPLLPFQKEGLGWMYHQEIESEVHGGILADEMGMGKTIQTISTILSNRPNPKDEQQSKTWNEVTRSHGEAAMKLVEDVDGTIKKAGTLVVVPTVAITQWVNEIARYVLSFDMLRGRYD